MALTTRRRALTTLGAALAGSLVLPAAHASAEAGKHGPRPLWRAHAHNDYDHPRPLFDASTTASAASRPTSTWSATSFWSPTTPSTSTQRTLESLYLDPLAALVKSNHGSVHRDGGHRCSS